MRIDLKPNGYDEARGRAFFEQLLDGLRADPGVDSATLAANPPMTLVDTGASASRSTAMTPRRDEDLAFLWKPWHPTISGR